MSVSFEEFKQTPRRWKVFKIDVDFLTVSGLTSAQLASSLAPKFRAILESERCELVRGSFHRATPADKQAFEIEEPSGFYTYIVYGVSRD